MGDVAQIYPHGAVNQAIGHRVGPHAASEAAAGVCCVHRMVGFVAYRRPISSNMKEMSTSLMSSMSAYCAFHR